ncbi:ribosome maturation factor RimP [Gleimia sp. 6138-11-ORH1]|uniref:ribosome maturation factor RimP n=1 Tax=Gleimia sp. 6138-11-ORH1 TaxID=2973937 RepID=UPI002167A5C7|nr:ribosome maturation factor RimP [Gleimia sp. 6138-11-ORH1]MCS4484214.1 ribosome maturation factor RimP [Gleimia sp. 6138-11-ORH1]
MSNTELEKTIADIVLAILPSKYHLEDVTVKTGNETTVRITVDIEAGTDLLTSDELQEISWKISEALDQADPVDGAYNLEISSPGAERRLHTIRHYQRSVGQLIEITLKDKTKISGYLRTVEGTTLTVQKKVSPAKPGMKAPEGEIITLEHENISKARVRVEFGNL